MGGGVSKNRASESGASEGICKKTQAKVKYIERTAPRKVEEGHATLTLKIDGKAKNVAYAFLSQAGYYPHALDKKNQDALMVKGNCGDQDETLAFFGVFDGHGKEGDKCSGFAKCAVLDLLENDKAFKDSNYYQALVNAHVNANLKMHEQEDNGMFSDILSGTTSITAMLDRDTLYVANVGDSRAISIIQMPTANGVKPKLMASPLSVDHTPFRQDEKVRVKKCGARVLTIGQLDGYQDPNIQDFGEEEENDGDPPRLWHPAGRYPGTAFTRSLGDRIAEEIGVFAVPEVLKHKLSPYDHYLLLASDGVFEFITSQGVVDIFERYKSDLLGACRAIVAEAYRQWLQFEVRTDDITVMIVDLRSVTDGQRNANNSTPSMYKGTTSIAALVDELNTQFTNYTQDASRKLSSSYTLRKTKDEETNMTEKKLPTAKSESDMSFRLDEPYVQSSFKPDPASVALVNSAVEGGAADGFSSNGKENNNSTSNSMLHMQMRPVRRKITVDLGVVSFDQSELEGYTMPSFPKSESDATAIQCGIQDNFLFTHLDKLQLDKVIAAMREVKCKPGDVVIKQFDKGDCFYVACSGRYKVEVSVPKMAEDPTGRKIPLEGQFEEPHEVMEYNCAHGVNPSFGELALMYNRPRAATIRCVEAGQLWALERKSFHSAVGRNSAHHLIKVLRKVDAFKQLTFNEVARLVELLTEVEFAPGQHIVKQGDKGDQFFVVKKGTVVVTIDDESPDVPPEGKEVMQLAEYDYFGERALINSAPRAANVIAKEHVVCLMIRKPLFDEVLGRLRQVLREDGERREDVAGAYYKINSLDQLRIFQGEIPFHSGVLYKCELCEATEAAAVAAAGDDCESGKDNTPQLSVRSSERKRGTLRRILLPEAKEKCELMKKIVTNELKILRLISRPSIVAEFAHHSNPLILYQLFKDEFVSDMKTIITNRPLDPSSNMLKYTMKVMTAALVNLHQNRGVLCRSVTPEAVMLDSEGGLQLTDFRFAKITAGARTFTVCGVPEYMAPEQIKGTGHGFAADFWGLGMLLIELISGETPWGKKSEMQIYENITNPTTISVLINRLAESLEPSAAKLLEGLLESDPERRLSFTHENDIEAISYFSRMHTKHSPFLSLAKGKIKGHYNSSSPDIMNV